MLVRVGLVFWLVLGELYVGIWVFSRVFVKLVSVGLGGVFVVGDEAALMFLLLLHLLD